MGRKKAGGGIPASFGGRQGGALNNTIRGLIPPTKDW